MPVRRPSASTGHTTSAASASSARTHRSNDSHHTFVPHHPPPTQPPSLAYLGASATPQQKVVQVLVNRLKNKLPCNSGVSITQIENDNATTQALEALIDLSHDSLDIIAWALTEQLDKLAKQTDVNGHWTVEVLQSQLFILKVLSVAMATRWNDQEGLRSLSRASKNPNGGTPVPDSPLPSGSSSRKKRQPSSEHSSSTPPFCVEPPPLDDACAKYILSVMVLFLRQTAPPETRLMSSSNLSIDASFHDLESIEISTDIPPEKTNETEDAQHHVPPIPGFPRAILRSQHSSGSFKSNNGSIVMSPIPIPARNAAFEKTNVTLSKSSLSLNILIAKFAGRIVYHLSASNWPVVFQRIRTKIHLLASVNEENPDVVDLGLMTHSALDRTRLVQVLHELSSLLINMKKEAQAAVAIPLRTAVWNWMNVFPGEFNDAIRSRGRTEGAPERVFDLLYSAGLNGYEKALWPTLTILTCITSERMPADFQAIHFGFDNVGGQKVSHRREMRFFEDLFKYANTPSKLSDVALVCALDICKAGMYVRPHGEIPLRIAGSDIAHEIKSALLKTANSKPFWELNDDIDVSMYAEALVAVFRYLPDDESIRLFTICIEPERSDAVKICVVKACLTLSMDAPRMPWQHPLEKLQLAMAPRFRNIYKVCSLKYNELDKLGNLKRAAARPRAKRFTSETLVDRELLILAILSLWRANSMFYLVGMDEAEISTWLPSAVKIWEAPVDSAIKISAASSFNTMSEIMFKMRPGDPFFDIIVVWMKQALSACFLGVVTSLLHARTDVNDQRMWVTIAFGHVGFFHRKTDSEHARAIQLSPDRISAFALAEIAFLVSLTCSDSSVSSMAAQGLRLIAQAERQPGAPVNPGLNDEDRSKRYPIYEQLGDPGIMIVGRVGHQKRVRKLVRLIAYPSPTHIAVWQECYWRWRALGEYVTRSPIETSIQDDMSLSAEEKIFQWRNLTLFLAAYGGACALENHEPSSLTTVIAGEFLPDEMRVLQNPIDMVGSFIQELLDLLVCDNLQIRDVARDALGSELSPRLHARLFHHLDGLTRSITNAAGPELTGPYTMFLDQFIAVLKLLVENASTPQEEVLTDDISSIILSLAEFITRFNEPASFRIKLKFSSLCECVFRRSDTLTLRKDTDSRHKILHILMEWIQNPVMVADTDFVRVQTEVNLSCLRTAVLLLDRLPLRPLEQTASDDSAHAVSRLFHRYSSTLLQGLDICQAEILTSDSVSDIPSTQQNSRALEREAELRELVIVGLSHLVSSNTESGFKVCLPLAYDDDFRKRVIFAHVFARVLGQGTKFEPADNSTTTSRQSRLRELVKGSDMVLAIAICETCPPAEVDIMISVLLNMFDTRPSLMALLKTMIDREIAHTESESSLFRSNSTCTRFLSAFARIHGYNYLRSIILPLIKTMASMPHGNGYDMDPTKVGLENVEQNQKNVELVTSSFLEIILASVPAFPSMFREICAHIAKSVSEVWPEAKFAAIGAFIFLRFISPAIVAPETVDVEIPKEDTWVIRRGLMIIAKVVQNLANNIFFGKEQHMLALNDFLRANIANVTRYLSEVNKFSSMVTEDENDEWLGTTYDDTDTIVLHRYFEKNADKIGKELLSIVKPNPESGESSAATGKRVWDSLCAALVDLKQPLEVPKLSPYNRNDHREYISLITRCAHRNTDAVRGIFVETDGPKDEPAIFIFFMNKIDVETLEIDLLLYHIFKTLTSPTYENRNFEVVVDCTSFTSMSEVPVQLLKYCAELIPLDIRQRFWSTYLLNPNALMQKYLRRLYNVSAGATFSGEIKVCSSVAELMEHIDESSVAPLVNAASLENETFEDFKEVNMRQIHQIRTPVVLEVRLTHLRITSFKAQPISPTLSCRYTEVIPLSDVSDVYNVSMGHDSYEFIIRKNRQGVTLYFSSPKRDAIIKAIRAAKSQLKITHTPAAERFSRFSNAPATLLHMGMLHIDSEEDELRSAAYDLLGAVCLYLHYDKNPVIASKTGFIPSDPNTFVVQLSDRLSSFAPQLTLDFISEVVSGMEKVKVAQRISCLQYMSPWIKNLAHFPNPASPHYEHSGARLREIIRTLIDLTINDKEISSSVQKYVWFEIGRLDTIVVNAVIDELMRSAADGGIGTERCEVVARTVATISSINVRGRILSKLRKVIGKMTTKSTRTLADDPNWNEIATLVRLALVSGNHSRQISHNQLFVPEIAHLVTLIAGTGQTLVRKSVYSLVMNLLQALYLARVEDSGPELRLLIDECTQPKTLQLFGLVRTAPSAEYVNYDPSNDKSYIDNQEELTRLLIRIVEATAGTKGLLNVWHARWMSLVTSTAFQHSPAIQSRCFIVLGTLATSDVDDDFLYQMFVAFKVALSQSSESDTTSVVSMLRCIYRVVPALQHNSRYLAQVFWLAVGLLQSSHIAFYMEAGDLLRASLETLEAHGAFKDKSVATFLLEGRVQLEEVACELDNILRLSFATNFSLSLASIIFKGVRHSGLKYAAKDVLLCLLRVTNRSQESALGLNPEALGYFLALVPFSTTRESYSQLLEACTPRGPCLTEPEPDENDIPTISLEFLNVEDSHTALLLISFVGTMLTTAQGDDTETQMLYTLLADLAALYPDVVSMAYEILQDRIKDTFANSTNPAIIKAVSLILRAALQDPIRSLPLRGGSVSTLGIVEENLTNGLGQNHLLALEEVGMQGLANNFQFLPANRGHATHIIKKWIPDLVTKIIE